LISVLPDFAVFAVGSQLAASVSSLPADFGLVA
jgi:hypothetical protein